MLRTLLVREYLPMTGEPAVRKVNSPGKSDKSLLTIYERTFKDFTVGLTDEGRTLAPQVFRAVRALDRLRKRKTSPFSEMLRPIAPHVFKAARALRPLRKGRASFLTRIGDGNEGIAYLSSDGLVIKHVMIPTKGRNPVYRISRMEALRQVDLGPDIKVPKQYGYISRRGLFGEIAESYVVMEYAPGREAEKVYKKRKRAFYEMTRDVINRAEMRILGEAGSILPELHDQNVLVDKALNHWIIDQ